MPVMDAVAGAILIAIRIFGAGWWWTGTKSSGVMRVVRALLMGIMLNLAPLLILAPAGWWTPMLDWCSWGVLVFAGMFFAWRRGACSRSSALEFVRAVGAMILLNVVIALWPVRSEWLAGGWDPGIYQNNAIAIANRNGIQAQRDSIYARMTTEERITLSRGSDGYREIFPSVPVRIEDGSIPLYSFHLTPMLGAWLHRIGGMDFLLRMPVFLAFWMLPVMAALFHQAGWRGWRSGVVVAAVMLSPLWWYHQAIPTAEMLYLLLLSGGLWRYLEARAKSSAYPVAAGLALFLATINHFNVPVVAGLLFFVMMLFLRPGDRVVRGLLFCFASIGLGIVYDFVFAAITLERLQEKDQVIGWVLGPFIFLFAMAMVMAWMPRSGRAQAWLDRSLRIAGFLAGVMVAGAVLLLAVSMIHAHWFGRVTNLPVIGAWAHRFSRIQLFVGMAGVLWSGWGLLILYRRAIDTSSVLMTALGVVFLSFLVNPGIAEIYPWGFRRYLPALITLVAGAQAMVVISFLEGLSRRSRLLNVLMALLLIVATGSSLMHVAQARQTGDYAGMSKVMREISLALEDRDVLVADDPAWGTPLFLGHGHSVVNGKLLWSSDDAGHRGRFLAALDRLEREDARRTVWLTSTGDGMKIYPDTKAQYKLARAFDVYDFRTVIHSGRGSHFATRQESRTFRLYVASTTGVPP